MSQKTNLGSNHRVQEKIDASNENYDHGLSPLLMHNPNSKFIMAIKILSFDRFSNFLQIQLRQIEIYMLT